MHTYFWRPTPEVTPYGGLRITIPETGIVLINSAQEAVEGDEVLLMHVCGLRDLRDALAVDFGQSEGEILFLHLVGMFAVRAAQLEHIREHLNSGT